MHEHNDADTTSGAPGEPWEGLERALIARGAQRVVVSRRGETTSLRFVLDDVLVRIEQRAAGAGDEAGSWAALQAMVIAKLDAVRAGRSTVAAEFEGERVRAGAHRRQLPLWKSTALAIMLSLFVPLLALASLGLPPSAVDRLAAPFGPAPTTTKTQPAARSAAPAPAGSSSHAARSRVEAPARAPRARAKPTAARDAAPVRRLDVASRAEAPAASHAPATAGDVATAGGADPTLSPPGAAPAPAPSPQPAPPASDPSPAPTSPASSGETGGAPAGGGDDATAPAEPVDSATTGPPAAPPAGDHPADENGNSGANGNGNGNADGNGNGKGGKDREAGK